MPELRRPDDGQEALAGSVAHRVLFQLLSPGDSPDALAVAEVADVLARTDNLLRLSSATAHARRALRQCATGAVLMYVRHLLPPSLWEVAGVDIAVVGGRIDVLWRNGANLLIDEIKTGHAAATLSSTTRQVKRYVHSLSTAEDLRLAGLPDVRLTERPRNGRLIGARVLTTASPAASWFQPTTGPRTSLGDSGFQQCRCRPPP